MAEQMKEKYQAIVKGQKGFSIMSGITRVQTPRPVQLCAEYSQYSHPQKATERAKASLYRPCLCPCAHINIFVLW